MKHLASTVRSLAGSEEGSALPLVALSIFGLVSAGALAFDYSRLVAMDTELQNAADHAALAAATQLDNSGNCALPTQAAQNLVANETRLSNEGAPLITVPSVVCANGTVTVTVAARRVHYTLLDINPGETTASARAGLASAVCKVPPLMMCNPAESGVNSDFDVGAYVGKGILAKAGGGGSWVPGNFGFLEVGASPSANNLRDIFGKLTTQFQCVPETGVTTAPGNMTAVSTAVNTRFDIYDSGWAAGCGPSDCPSALNTSKDVVRSGTGCTFNANGGQGWRFVPQAERYLPDPATRTDTNVTSMGHPRDICHAVSANGDCAEGRIGDGNWDRATYFNVNHPLVPAASWQADLGPNPTRYAVYQWEIARSQLAPRPVVGGFTSHKGPACSAGVGSSATTVDRRKASVAVINCIEQSVNGHATNVQTVQWIDVFLVEPSLPRDRTNTDEIYVEVIGETQTAGNGEQGQLVSRKVPYLIE